MSEFEEILKKGYLLPYSSLLAVAFPLYQWDITNSVKDITGSMLMGRWWWRPNKEGGPSFIYVYFTEGEGVYYKDRLILSFDFCPSQGSGIKHTVMGPALEDPEKFIWQFQDEVRKEAQWIMESNFERAEKSATSYKKGFPLHNDKEFDKMGEHLELTEGALTLIQSLK